MNLARLVEVWNTGIPVVVLTAQDPFSLRQDMEGAASV